MYCLYSKESGFKIVVSRLIVMTQISSNIYVAKYRSHFTFIFSASCYLLWEGQFFLTFSLSAFLCGCFGGVWVFCLFVVCRGFLGLVFFGLFCFLFVFFLKPLLVCVLLFQSGPKIKCIIEILISSSSKISTTYFPCIQPIQISKAAFLSRLASSI